MLTASLLTVSALVLAMAPAGCGQSRPGRAPSASPPASSGIQGTITVDIGCPHVTSTPCPRRPLRARLLIRPAEASGPPIQANSAADGSYRVPLAPGTYTIQPQNLTGAPVPAAFPLTVTVRPATWTTLPVEFDSGIR